MTVGQVMRGSAVADIEGIKKLAGGMRAGTMGKGLGVSD